MMHPETHAITEKNGPRPAGHPEKCFYCDLPIGADHMPNCACRRRTVVVRVTAEYTVTVPEYWDASMVTFHRNESTWCADNGLRELNDRTNQGCLCGLLKYEYVREATVNDEADTWDGDLGT